MPLCGHTTFWSPVTNRQAPGCFHCVAITGSNPMYLGPSLQVSVLRPQASSLRHRTVGLLMVRGAATLFSDYTPTSPAQGSTSLPTFVLCCLFFRGSGALLLTASMLPSFPRRHVPPQRAHQSTAHRSGLERGFTQPTSHRHNNPSKETQWQVQAAPHSQEYKAGLTS